MILSPGSYRDCSYFNSITLSFGLIGVLLRKGHPEAAPTVGVLLLKDLIYLAIPS